MKTKTSVRAAVVYALMQEMDTILGDTDIAAFFDDEPESLEHLGRFMIDTLGVLTRDDGMGSNGEGGPDEVEQ